MNEIKLPPLPDIPAAICPWDHSEGVVKNLLEAYATAAIEADRKTLSSQLSAYKRLTESLEKRLTFLQAKYDELKISNNPDLLASERAANTILTAELEADRQKNNALIRYMPEAIAALKATGCNDSLVSDIQKAVTGSDVEAGRQARGEPQTEREKWLASLFPEDQMFEEIDQMARESYKRHMSLKRGQMVVRADAWDSHVVWATKRWIEANEPNPMQIPEGYKLVPIEPTDKMLGAALWHIHGMACMPAAYKAMLEAAQSADEIKEEIERS